MEILLQPSPRGRKLQELARRIAELNREIDEIRRVIRSLPAGDSATAAYIAALRERLGAALHELADRYAELSALIREGAQPHLAVAEQGWAEVQPPVWTPSVAGTELPGQPDAPAHPARHLSQEEQQNTSPTPVDTVPDVAPRSSRAVVILAAGTAVALTLSVIAFALTWSLLTGLIVPRAPAASPFPLSAAFPATLEPSAPTVTVRPTAEPSTTTVPVRPTAEVRDDVLATVAIPAPGAGAAEHEAEPASEEVPAPDPGVGHAVVSAPASFGGVRLRERPTTRARVLRSVPNGTSVELLAGSAVADRFRWVRVRVGKGVEGWVVAVAVRDP